MARVLRHYAIGLRPGGPDQLVGVCPLHPWADNPTAFRVHLRRGGWHCFTRCGGGDVLDLVARLEGVSLYQAARKLLEWAGPWQPADSPGSPPETPPAGSLAPLPFRLPLSPHPYLTETRGLHRQTTARFGLGFCHRGILAGRIAIPLHDAEDRLVAYAGRRLDPSQGEKYRFPRGFPKGLLVYNSPRISPEAPSLVVVEGFFDVFHLYQKGYPDTVALMGTTASSAQLEWLLATGKPLTLLFDGDPAGQAGQARLAEYLRRHGHPFRAPHLTPGNQPEHLTSTQLETLLGAPLPPFS